MEGLPVWIPQWYIWLIVSILLPLIEQFVIGKNWPSWAKVLMSFGVSVIVSIGACYFGGQLTWGNFLASLGLIFTTAQIFYDAIWKKSLLK